MSRLIDADDVVGVMRVLADKMSYEGATVCEQVIGVVENVPTIDAVEVVRCKDCAYAVESKRVEASCFPVFCAVLEARMKDDDYCSQGEKSDRAAYFTRRKYAGDAHIPERRK